MLNWWRRHPKIRREAIDAHGPPPPRKTQFGTAPGTEIRYNPDLPSRLAGEHSIIMGLIDTITATENGKDLHLLRRGLRKRIHTEENDLSLLYVEPGRF